MGDRIDIDGASLEVFRDPPTFDGLRTAAVGKFKCKTQEAGGALLHHVCESLVAEGVQAVIGPLDGDTWHNYRLVTETDGSPPFLMEPISGQYDLISFRSAGFAEIAHYVSARQPLDDIAVENSQALTGIQVDTWDGSDPEQFFAEVHTLSLKAFARNPFYQPIALSDFLAIYLPLVPMIRRELILFARDQDGTLQGFFFAVPDYQQGPKPKDVIFKTYASLIPGVGRMLVNRAVRVSADLGFRNAIHALMHADNRSADRSDRIGGEIFRRYALMGRILNE